MEVLALPPKTIKEGWISDSSLQELLAPALPISNESPNVVSQTENANDTSARCQQMSVASVNSERQGVAVLSQFLCCK